MMDWELRLGRWEEALANVSEVDAIIVDPPYSARTHDGHDAGANMANRKGGWGRSNGEIDAFRARRELSYAAWGQDQIESFVSSWAPRCRGWFAAFSDSELFLEWRGAFERHGLTGFAPLPVLIPGMSVRMSGDGPSSWAIYVNVARPKALARWNTRPGGYYEDEDGRPSVFLPPVPWYRGPQGEREHIGGKPLWLMRALVQHYTAPGDLVCDPCAGAGTTLLAALMEGRRAIGCEVDPEIHGEGEARIRRGYTPDLWSTVTATKRCSACHGLFLIAAFARDRTSPSGRQSQCRRCKAEWEAGKHGAWHRFRAWLEKKEPASLQEWTETEYIARWERVNGKCELCGAGLAQWQIGGHRMDRIDNDLPHVPSNCRLLCWPCNEYKSSGNPVVKDNEILAYVDRYGIGNVPWRKIREEKGYLLTEFPDVEQYRAEPLAEQLDFFGTERRA